MTSFRSLFGTNQFVHAIIYSSIVLNIIVISLSVALYSFITSVNPLHTIKWFFVFSVVDLLCSVITGISFLLVPLIHTKTISEKWTEHHNMFIAYFISTLLFGVASYVNVSLLLKLMPYAGVHEVDTSVDVSNFIELFREICGARWAGQACISFLCAVFHLIRTNKAKAKALAKAKVLTGAKKSEKEDDEVLVVV